MPPEGDYNSRGAADGLLSGLKKYPEKDLGAALLVFGSGDGGGGPGEIHLEVTSREADLRGLPRVEYSRAATSSGGSRRSTSATGSAGSCTSRRTRARCTTNAEIKKHTRIVERKLHEAEALAAIVGERTRDLLEPVWRDVLLHHFHDILPGSSIARVSSRSRRDPRAASRASWMASPRSSPIGCRGRATP